MAMADRVRTLILGAAGRDFHNFNVVYRDDAGDRGGRLHRRADSGDRRPALSGGAGRTALSRRHTDRGRGPSGKPVPARTRRSRSSSPTATAARGGDASRLARSRRRRRLRPSRAARGPCCAPACRSIAVSRDPHGLRQVADGALAQAAAARAGAARRRAPPPDAVRRSRAPARAALRAPAPTSMRRSAPPRSARSTSRTSPPATSSSPASTTPRSSGRRRRDADVIVWDGGNNDFPFLRPDLHIVMADALRPGAGGGLPPGGDGSAHGRRRRGRTRWTRLRAPTCSTSSTKFAASIRARTIVRAASPVRLDDAAAVRGRRVLVVEDGPTITHGGMPYGAGYVAAVGRRRRGDRRSAPLGHRGRARGLPALPPHRPRPARRRLQRRASSTPCARRSTRADADLVVSATPIDLAALIAVDKRVVRARVRARRCG